MLIEIQKNSWIAQISHTNLMRCLNWVEWANPIMNWKIPGFSNEIWKKLVKFHRIINKSKFNSIKNDRKKNCLLHKIVLMWCCSLNVYWVRCTQNIPLCLLYLQTITDRKRSRRRFIECLFIYFESLRNGWNSLVLRFFPVYFHEKTQFFFYNDMCCCTYVWAFVFPQRTFYQKWLYSSFQTMKNIFWWLIKFAKFTFLANNIHVKKMFTSVATNSKYLI